MPSEPVTVEVSSDDTCSPRMRAVKSTDTPQRSARSRADSFGNSRSATSTARLQPAGRLVAISETPCPYHASYS